MKYRKKSERNWKIRVQKIAMGVSSIIPTNDIERGIEALPPCPP